MSRWGVCARVCVCDQSPPPPRVAGIQGDCASFPPPGAAEVKGFSLAYDAAASSDLPAAEALPEGAQLPLKALGQLGGTGDGRDATVLLHCMCVW